MSSVLDIIGPHLKNVKSSGPNNVMASCPLPDHDDHNPSFAINTENGLWICHGCGRSGSLPTLLRLIGQNPAIASDFKRVAGRKKKRGKRKEVQTLPEALLGVYDWKPLDLVRAGFDPKLLREFEIGYDKEHERITFPLRDISGNLLAIAGRATLEEDKPKYRWYKYEDFGRELGHTLRNYEPRVHDHLWNGHRVYASMLHGADTKSLYIVEGFKACLWLVQHGYKKTVALMGSSMSREQHRLVHLLNSGEVILFLDNDEAGINGTRKIGAWLKKTIRRVSVCVYPEGVSEPDGLDEEALKEAVKARKEYRKWVSERG